MTQNLALSNYELTPSDSDVETNFNLPGQAGNNWINTYDQAMVYDPENADYGFYYNYYSATAGTVSGNTGSDSMQSICPKGWTLPKANKFQNLATVYGPDAIKLSPANFKLSGGYNAVRGVYNQESHGDFWSSTYYDEYEQSILVVGITEAGNFHNGREDGNTIRCIASKPEPTIETIVYMQEMTSDICAAAPTPLATDGANTPQYKLKDNRDNKEYWVAKLADGKCWMTQNLDLDLSSSITLTNTNTDLNTVTSWTPIKSTIPTEELNSTNYGSDNTTPYSYDAGNRYYYTSNSDDEDINYSSLADCVNANHAEAECIHYHVGNYYSFTAAIASNDSSALTTQYTDAPNSICPKGWRLWKANHNESEAGETSILFSTYGLVVDVAKTTGAALSWAEDGFKNIRTAPFYVILSSYINSGNYAARYVSTGQPILDFGTYWSSTIYSNRKAYQLGINKTSLSPQYEVGDRNRGEPIRCVAR